MGEKYRISKTVMENDRDREGFVKLIKAAFGIDFEEWYQAGEWSQWNMPYTMYDGDKAIANVTVNNMKLFFGGKEKNYYQLGGIATDTEYRGRGLSRELMELVLRDIESADGVFLIANNTVTDFYPKFGFVEERMYECHWKKSRSKVKLVCKNAARRIDYSLQSDRELVERCYKKRNPFSRLQFVDNFSLLQFYFHMGMDEDLYYVEEEDALLVAELEDDIIRCLDIYYEGDKSLMEMMEYVMKDDTQEIYFLFTPVDKTGLEEKEFFDEDTHLFVLKNKENLFNADRLFVPEISYT